MKKIKADIVNTETYVSSQLEIWEQANRNMGNECG